MLLLMCAWIAVALCFISACGPVTAAIRRAAASRCVKEMPAPRTPRELTRFYPRRGAAACWRRLSTCPVCGMTDPGGLDGDLLGWPAHSACAEWLGGWKPEPGSMTIARIRRCSVRVFRAKDGSAAVRHWSRGVLYLEDAPPRRQGL